MKKTLVLVILFMFSCSVWALPPAPKKPGPKPVPPRLRLGDEGMPESEGLPQLVVPPPPPPVVPPPGRPAASLRARYGDHAPLQGGLMIGLMSNIPAAKVEIKWNNPLNLAKFAIKTGVMYAQGADDDKVERKHALIFLDGLLRLSHYTRDSVGMYGGVGINYLALTSGRVSGQIGGQIYLGFDSMIRRGEIIYTELGYGTIRTGFSPAYNGLIAMIGYRFYM